tara:strand:+ start:1385 stop:1594 length:210 start_codon:yes stop_codon:yes gene_type:complete
MDKQLARLEKRLKGMSLMLGICLFLNGLIIGFTLKKLNSIQDDNRIYFSELEAKIKFIARNMKIKRVVK